jgi:hypothetical protein
VTSSLKCVGDKQVKQSDDVLVLVPIIGGENLRMVIDLKRLFVASKRLQQATRQSSSKTLSLK